MDKQIAIFTTYCLAEALNNPEMKKVLLHLYGTNGVEQAEKGVRILAMEYAFEAPLLAQPERK